MSKDKLIEERMLFCNIAYLKEYDRAKDSKPPQGGGSYISKHKTGGEIDNFHLCTDGNYYGFVEVGKTADRYDTIHIENIDEHYEGKDAIPDVTVVFCASLPNEKGSVIIGWYEHATVFRKVRKDCERIYNIVARQQNVVLLPENERNIKAPRSPMDGFGFGQKNLWYATGEDVQTLNYRRQVLEFIRQYNSRDSYVWSEEGENVYIEGSEKMRNTSFIERNAAAREACLRLRGNHCLICGFDGQNVYGDGFDSVIHVHHIISLSERKAEYQVDPTKDLIPVCPNCHMALHTKVNGRYLSPEELKKRYEKIKKGSNNK